MDNINIWAVVVAALSRFAVGSLWYSPLLFAKTWQKEAGLTTEDLKNANMAKTFGLSFLASFVMALFMSYFWQFEHLWDVGLRYGIYIGLGFVSMGLLEVGLFEQRSLKLFLINAGYQIVGFALMGYILSVWH